MLEVLSRQDSPARASALAPLLAVVAFVCAPWAAGGQSPGSPLPGPEYDETIELMALVEDAVALVGERGVEAACAELREPGTRWFQDEIYVFILDMEGRAVCHPAQPELEGQSLAELRDPHGKPVVQNFLRDLQGGSESGWEHYLWPTPGSTTFRWKTTHVRRAVAPDGTEYVVGSGLYEMEMERFFVVEQVNDAVDLLLAEGEEAFYTLRDRSTGFRFYDAYVFVLDPTGIMLVNVGFPDLENTSVATLRDGNGKMVGQEILAIPADEGVWVDYLWPKPGETQPSQKSSYVRRIRVGDQEYIVGAGVYFR
jgi:signal transduction histidine kinase